MSTSSLLNSLKTIWERWSLAERIRFGAAVLLCLLGLCGIVYWSSQAEYVLLADHLSPETAHKTVTALEAASIPYRLSYAGTSILVPRQQLHRSRLAVRDVIQEAPFPATAENYTDLWADPATLQQRQQRELEQRLVRSLTRLRGVRAAEVHLTMPQTSPFVRSRQPAKASVVLELDGTSGPVAVDSQAIIALVANSVEGLEPAQITLLDTQGRLLSNAQGMESSISSQLDYRAWLESHLAAKAEAVLAPLLGPHKSHVRVTADVDFTELSREEVRYDPTQKVKVSETIRSEQNTPSSPAVGPAGSPSNVGRAVSGPAAGLVKKEDIDTRFENSKTVDTIRERPGKTRRLTVAAVVELPADDQTTTKLTPQQLEGIIRQAVGLDESRGDTIEVVVGKLQSPELSPLEPTWHEHWQALEPLLRSASLGLGGLVAAIWSWWALRRLRPVVVPASASLPDWGMQQRLTRLQAEFRQDPQIMAELLNEWLAAEQDMPSTAAESRSQAA